jgi:hypothetical protein
MSLPVMACCACGETAVPLKGHDTTRYTVPLVCPHCRQVLKTVPKALLERAVLSQDKPQ